MSAFEIKKMDPKIKAAWVQALRSGDYQQTFGQLQRVANADESRPLGFCCLGVLCELAVAAGVINRYGNPYSSGVEYGMEYTRSSGGLVSAVTKWANLNSTVVIIDGEGRSLASINDGRDFTFAQIADLIEEQL